MQLESWPDCASELAELGQASWEETVPMLEPNRHFQLDQDALAKMDQFGVLKIITARNEAGVMLGYISWVLQFDVESFGTLIADQGSWYVKPGCWGVAWKLFISSFQTLRSLGVKFCYPHQRAIGRSASAGRFFERYHARPVKIVWSVDLQELPHA